MSTKNLKTRILMKRDSEINWLKAENFIPLPGEIIVYTADDTHEKPRIKIGDGETKVSDLPFATLGIPDIPQTQLIYEETLTMEYMTNTWITSGLIPLVVGNKYQVTIEDKTFSSVAVMEQWDSENSIAVLGNISLFYPDREDTGEPYCILAAFSPIDVGGASLLGAVVIDGTVWSDKESVYLKIEEGSPNHLMLTTNENGEMVWEEKTHYEYIDDVVPETEYSIADLMEEVEGFPVVTSSDIIEGNDYIVFYNGVEYKVKCKKIDTGYTFLTLGNPGIFGEEDNGFPFIFLFPVDSSLFPDNIQGAFLPIDQIIGENVDESQIKGTYSVKRLAIKKIDPKFIDMTALESDWNANEGEVGYIKNRTHYVYEGLVDIVPETSFTEGEVYANGGVAFITTPTVLENNKTYTVSYNGTDYQCVASVMPAKPILAQFGVTVDDSVIGGILGNMGALDPSVDTGEPFVLMAFQGKSVIGAYGMLLPLVSPYEGSFAIREIGEVVEKLDKKFLPDGLFYMDNKPGGNLIAQCDSIPGLIDGGDTPLLYPLEEGRSYTINIGGDIFQSVCKVTDNFLGGEAPILYLGNLKQFNSTLPDSRESYVFVQNTERQIIGYYVNHVKYAGKTFTITLNEEYNKFPSKHLPTPNWSARKGEEGHIENRTHYCNPGVTASWDGTTEGKASTTITIGNDSLICYKISDNFSVIDPTLLFSEKKGQIISSSGINYIFPLYVSENNDFIHLFGMDNIVDGILSASSKDVTFFFSLAQSIPFSVSVPSPGLYYIKISDATIRETFNVVIEDEVKTLDPMYINKTTLGTVSIISSDYEALVSGGTRIENPTYHMDVTKEELHNILAENKLGAINLYYTKSMSDDEGHILPIERIDNILTGDWTNPSLHKQFYCYTATNDSGKYARIKIYTGNANFIEKIEWLEAASSSIELDTTLKVSGKAADAKAVGDAIREAAFSGNYNDLTNKPTIPSIEGLATESYVDSAVANLVDAPRTSIVLSDTVTGQAYNLYIANGELKIKEVEA